MIYKIYKAQVTGGGYLPQGDCKATLLLDEARNPTWTEMSEDFRELCLPWFQNTIRMGVIDDMEPLKSYSEEALEHLAKHQLPSQGFVMVTVEGPKSIQAQEKAKAAPAKQLPPPIFGYNSPPPGLFKKS